MAKSHRPVDVAFTESDNGSLFVVLVMDDIKLADYFFRGIIKDKEIDFTALVNEEDGTHTFVLKSSNSPETFVIPTKRTLKNNPSLNKFLSPDYRDYTYLTCGYKNDKHDEVLSNQSEAVPVFINLG